MRRLAILPILGLALALGAPWANAHNNQTQPDCNVQILKTTNPKPDVYWSLDGSGSMQSSCSGCGGVPKITIAKQAITAIVNDPQVDGSKINFGYQEWSSGRVGSCAAKRFVDIINDGNTSAAVTAAVAGATAVYNTPTWKALEEAEIYYRTDVQRNDTIACRDYYVAMITDGYYNCWGSPCPMATTLATDNVAILACAFDIALGAVTCLGAAHPNGAVIPANSLAALIQGFKDLLKQTLTSNVTIGASVTGTIKDPNDPNYTNISRNATVVATIEVPAFEGHFLAYNVLKPDLVDPAKTKLLNDFTLLFDAGCVSRPPGSGNSLCNGITGALTVANRKVFTTDVWATCFHGAGGDPTGNCSATVAPPALTYEPFTTSNGWLTDARLNTPAGTKNNVINNVLGVKSAPSNFMIWASTGAAGSIQIPSNADIQDGSYQAFVASQSPNGLAMSQRETIYYAGTDSGGVHAFSTRTVAAQGWTKGLEKWMYIPKENLSRLKNLLGPPGQSIDTYTYFAQGTPVVFDVKTSQNWKTVLTFGLGNGGRSYYGLDVTWPDSWTVATPYPTLLWAFADADNVAQQGQPVLTLNDFGSVGLAISGPSNNDPTKGEVIFGSGPANDHLSQPSICVGNPLSDPDVGHRLYRVDMANGELLGSTITYNVGGLNGGTPMAAGNDRDDILRTTVNGMNRKASGILTEANDLENFFALDHYVTGGSRGHVYMWDGLSDNVLLPPPPHLIHVSTSKTTAASPEPGITRPVTQIPLVITPGNLGASCLSPSGTTIDVAAYFGTGDDATKNNPQFIYSVDLSSGVLPSFNQLGTSPTSPLALGTNEIVVGNPIVVRINPTSGQTTGAAGDTVVLFLGYTASLNPCGGGYSKLYALNACNPDLGGWDTNGNGVDSGDRMEANLGPGRATSMEATHGGLMVTGASSIFRFTDCDAAPPPGQTCVCCRQAPAPPLPEIYNWKIRDVN